MAFISNCKKLISLFITLLFCCYSLDNSIVVDATTNNTTSIKDPETLRSDNGNFTLGFFSPRDNSTNRYLGIWSKSEEAVVWVANRNQPLKNSSSGVFTISNDGNLVLLHSEKEHVIYWSSNSNVSNTTKSSNNSSFQLSDYGSLVLFETETGDTIWESFNHPSDTLLQHMRFSSNKSDEGKLTSWKTTSDPSMGSFSLSIEHPNLPELFVWNYNQTKPYWRSGPWNDQVFIGIMDMGTLYLNGFHVEKNRVGSVDFYFTADDFGLNIYVLNSQGKIQERTWNDEEEKWEVTWINQRSDCDVYGTCGAFGICNSTVSPICSCLEGFEPMNKEEWNRQNWSGGCVRKTPLLECGKRGSSNNDQNTSSVDGGGGDKEDGFLRLEMVKVPDSAEWSNVIEDLCRSQCLENCSCIAYSYEEVIGCMSWSVDLIDIQQFPSGGADLYIRVAHTELSMPEKGSKAKIIIIVAVVIGILILVAGACVIWRKSSHAVRIKKHLGFSRFKKIETSEECTSDKVIGDLSQAKLQELLVFSFEMLATATNDFHSSNKLGQGGFGPVYKGKLQDGKEIAVKRLSRASRQGLEEFMNEVVVISKLQHRNLVRLLGCCIEGDEKMLIYEYMPNKSLDAYVFDPSENKLLDWTKRFSIIEGIARGLLYLHRDSRLKIIHRDMKASNILLDAELNPKISDFGMAKIFGGSEDQANTQRVVGTYGYMSPEYAMQGVFSEKSDVFSFGVLLIEIVSGKRNSSFYESENSLTLIGYAWTQWREDNISSIIDPKMRDHSLHNNISRCIHIGLLCVQESAADRPTMAAVISMLNSEIMDLPPAREPAFILRQNMQISVSSEESNRLHSINAVSITDIQGR